MAFHWMHPFEFFLYRRPVDGAYFRGHIAHLMEYGLAKVYPIDFWVAYLADDLYAEFSVMDALEPVSVAWCEEPVLRDRVYGVHVLPESMFESVPWAHRRLGNMVPA